LRGQVFDSDGKVCDLGVINVIDQGLLLDPAHHHARQDDKRHAYQNVKRDYDYSQIGPRNRHLVLISVYNFYVLTYTVYTYKLGVTATRSWEASPIEWNRASLFPLAF